MLGHYHIDTVGHEVTSPHAAAASSEEQAFDEISIRDIAERAQIGYATFFRNYESLRAVLHDLIADQIRQVIRLTFPAIEGTNGRAAALALCTFVDEHRRLWTSLLTAGAAGIVRDE